MSLPSETLVGARDVWTVHVSIDAFLFLTSAKTVFLFLC